MTKTPPVLVNLPYLKILLCVIMITESFLMLYWNCRCSVHAAVWYHCKMCLITVSLDCGTKLYNRNTSNSFWILWNVLSFFFFIKTTAAATTKAPGFFSCIVQFHWWGEKCIVRGRVCLTVDQNKMINVEQKFVLLFCELITWACFLLASNAACFLSSCTKSHEVKYKERSTYH